VLLLGLPAGVGLMALAGPLVATLFHSGEFGGEDVAMASRSLIAYAAGLLPFITIKVLAPGFYARQDARTPLRIALVALLANLVLSLALMGPLGHAGLALATSLAALVNAALLLWVLLREGIYRPAAGWPARVARAASATLLMGALLVGGTGATTDWLAWDTGRQIGHLAGWILLGALTYLGALFLLGVRPHELADRA
jgi:putative peptidoglycan lipid II flippase